MHPPSPHMAPCLPLAGFVLHARSGLAQRLGMVSVPLLTHAPRLGQLGLGRAQLPCQLGHRP
jgi:hypothetical protein